MIREIHYTTARWFAERLLARFTPYVPDGEVPRTCHEYVRSWRLLSMFSDREAAVTDDLIDLTLDEARAEDAEQNRIVFGHTDPASVLQKLDSVFAALVVIDQHTASADVETISRSLLEGRDLMTRIAESSFPWIMSTNEIALEFMADALACRQAIDIIEKTRHQLQEP